MKSRRRVEGTVGVGVIGVGLCGREHARRLGGGLPGARVVAVADADLARARAVAETLPGARALATGAEVIAAAAVDAVVVAAPGAAHEELVLAAIAAGKPVFCEKPLAPTPAACLRLVAAETAAGRRLVQVGFMRRYDAGYLALRRAVDAGEIGPPLLMHCVHRNATAPAWFTREMPITDSAAHEIDIVRWLLRDEVAEVTVIVPRRSGHAPADLPDPLVLLMRTRAGVRVDVEVFVNCQYGYEIRCEVVGETGTVSLASTADVLVRRAGRVTSPVAADWRDRFAGAYDAELAEWVRSVRCGRAAGPSCWDGYAAAAVARAACGALESGRAADVELAERPFLYE
jgi:myo-inositol 2-dehydrogenase / D-chiro-inositol 1-dehydrogenase